MKKRIAGLLLTLCVVMTLMPCAPVIAAPVYWTEEGTYDLSWYGDGSAAAYTITQPRELAGLAYLVNSGTGSFGNKTVTLGADIDLSAYDWTPIGSISSFATGITFDGGGHKITGMKVTACNDSSLAMVGLFGVIGGSTVKNLYVSGSVIIATGPRYLEYISAGGIAGWSGQSTIVNCGSDVDISVTCSGRLAVAVGGIAGRSDANPPASILNCYATGDLLIGGAINYLELGGIAGEVNGDDLRNCYFAGTLRPEATSPRSYTGGIGGKVTDGILSNCYYLPGEDGRPLTGTSTGATVAEGCGTFSDNTGALTPLPTHTLLDPNLLKALNAWGGTRPDSGQYLPWYVVAAVNGAYPQFTAPPVVNTPSSPESTPNTTNAPISDTGDHAALPLLLTVSALAALAGGAFAVKKRRKA